MQNYKIYIDINAGSKNIYGVKDLANFAMLRAFFHEFTHFIEKWNPIWYNEFRKAVFDELTARGEDVLELIKSKQTKGMSFEKASREVVAEAMTDILPDSHFVENLANKHKNIFQKLLEKLKEFLADIKAYFKSIVYNNSREANALKEQVGEAVHYVEKIVELFDKEEQALDSADEDTVQEQSRDYLYTDEDYNNYGWARENEVLSAKENERLRSLFADAVSNQANPPKTKSGEYMIAIGEDVDNKIAYMKGEIDSPVITHILEINLQDETSIDEKRRNVYEAERRGIQPPSSEIFRFHYPIDYGYGRNQQRGGFESKRYNDQFGSERGRGSKTAPRVKE